MKRRSWNNETKLKVVLDGMKGRPVSEICNEYQIAQSQYYQWRDVFLEHAAAVFSRQRDSGQLERVRQDNSELKQLVGELMMELKKTESEWG